MAVVVAIAVAVAVAVAVAEAIAASEAAYLCRRGGWHGSMSCSLVLWHSASRQDDSLSLIYGDVQKPMV